jgi:hypothetical protein
LGGVVTGRGARVAIVVALVVVAVVAAVSLVLLLFFGVGGTERAP